ncbi:MAG: protein-L-isoaspartate O-methyltransferase [bacterium]|nr:protein-L-isoaspartate O-methyltransferase [bacterium]
MNTYKELLDALVRDGYLKSPSLIEAFAAADRARFVPEEVRGRAYENCPLPIGTGQTISQPLTVALMLELLAPVRGNAVLDVGCGSGWQAALLSHVVGVHGKVVALERTKTLADRAAAVLAEVLPEDVRGVVRVVHADATAGFAEGGPYDRIISAASGSAIPHAWKDQLVVGGRIVAPVGESLVLLEKTGADEFTERRFPGFQFVPLVTGLG